MRYVFVTYHAIDEMVKLRQFHSPEYDEGLAIVGIIKNCGFEMPRCPILAQKSENGIVLYTENGKKDNGLLITEECLCELAKETNEHIINIFQKTLKCCNRMFSGVRSAPNEHLSNNSLMVMFPFARGMMNSGNRVLIDKNTQKEAARKGQVLYTAYYYGTSEAHIDLNVAALKRCIKEIGQTQLTSASFSAEEAEQIRSLYMGQLEPLELKLNSNIGYDNWKCYLTKAQKDFIERDISGAERLEGAAGTGKTLALILRCIYLLKKSNFTKRYIFVTHSIATKNHIIEVFRNNCPQIDQYLITEDNYFGSLLVTTIQEWCIKYLGAYISETEYLDKDARESKEYQLLVIADAYTEVKKNDLSTYEKLCSPEFLKFIRAHDSDSLYELLQYEIGVVIKGQAGGDIDVYKKLRRPKYGIPCKKDADFNLLYLIYTKYQNKLEISGQYDSDDIVISATMQLTTPIWKRRRDKEGFDACFVDETHLFNKNELNIFHYLNKTAIKNHIVVAIDKSQHVGEPTIYDEDSMQEMSLGRNDSVSSKFKTVFRSSPSIVTLAYSVLSSGIQLFGNELENPIENTISDLTPEEEKKLTEPIYLLVENEEKVVEKAFIEADRYVTVRGCKKSDVLIIGVSSFYSQQLEDYVRRLNKPAVVIKRRGDTEVYKDVGDSQRYVIGDIDYIGGLEFQYVIIVGIDAHTVPPMNASDESEGSLMYIKYSWFNRLYVALTRAKYGVSLIGCKLYGISPLLEGAVYYNHIGVIESN